MKAIVIVAIFFCSSSLYADPVYESTNDQGVVEFSDKPSVDAEVVDVEPNVVDVETVKSTPSSPRKAEAKEPEQVVEQPEVIETSGSSTYVREHRHRPKPKPRPRPRTAN